MTNKYFTIVIRADNESAARQLVPGATILGNHITACALGDQITLNEKFKELIPPTKNDAVERLEAIDIAPFLADMPKQTTVKSDPIVP